MKRMIIVGLMCAALAGCAGDQDNAVLQDEDNGNAETTAEYTQYNRENTAPRKEVTTRERVETTLPNTSGAR